MGSGLNKPAEAKKRLKDKAAAALEVHSAPVAFLQSAGRLPFPKALLALQRYGIVTMEKACTRLSPCRI